MNKSKPSKPSQPEPDSLSPMNESELGLDDLFLASARQDLLSIEQALARRDYCAIQQTVHSLKGAAMIFRVPATANAALHIEAVLNTGLAVDHDQLTAACAALRLQIELL
ncbi:Hpt domain-containing protein [Collimonas sp. OK307]|uniref:Hpt domain-containing protein n=1 Tax=Collimonas sp. OK307 TaxID=1801620 RepID=UPI0008E7FEFB|nr:Hpt domain-containing protein [Collimonas sp. OK307]SFH64185.1 Hpt domain-containing protein [Collimonas sp. OK307]